MTDVRDSTAARRLERATARIFELTSATDLRQLIDEYPELTTNAAAEAIDDWSRQEPPESRPLAAAHHEMLRIAASGDVDAAWQSYEQAMIAFGDAYIEPRVFELEERVDECERASDLAGAIEASEELLEIARTPGAPDFEANVSARLAALLLMPRGEGRAERLERAIALLTRVLELHNMHLEVAESIHLPAVLSNLGYAFSDRLYGDPLANQDRATERYEQVLELVTIDSDGDSWAIAHTNLGLALLERANLQTANEFSWQGEEPVDTEPDIAAAIEHFEAALRWRSFERDPRDWAFTQINLGLAYRRRRSGIPAENLRRALEHYEAAGRGYAMAGDVLHHAQVLHNIASERAALANLEETDEAARDVLLRMAVDASRASLAERTLTDAPVDAGRTWHQLGGHLRALGDDVGAADAYRESLRGLRSEATPRLARDAARDLADLEAHRQNWVEAANAWETAAEAAARAWSVRATAAGRLQELHENVNIFRWAAYALAKADRPSRAVEILELGRARELALWVEADHEELAMLREFDPQLALRYESVRRDLRRLDREHRDGGEVPAQSAAALAEEFASLSGEIRALPGLHRMHVPPDLASITEMLEPEDALVYILSAPNGSIALVITCREGCLSVTTVDAPEVRSQDLFLLFLSSDVEGETLGGYFTAHEAAGEELHETLERFSDALGPPLLRRVADAIGEAGATRICLIPISLLGLLPLASLSWEDGGHRCLLDTFDVIQTPSAGVLAVCRRRATRHSTSRRALIVGNPLPQCCPLPGAEFEAHLVARALTDYDVELLLREHATKERVIAAMRDAELVHLACHGAASILARPLNAALYLSHDEPLYADEILGLDDFSPRLVVASACETGVIQGYETADEALTLGAAFVAAGAAAVISSLWSVDDEATALLMSRFYEEVSAGATFARALRRSQLWLRELSDIDLDAYLVSRPVLRERLGTSRGSDQPAGLPRFSSMTRWGAFVYTGA